MRTRTNNSGFSVIELIIVLAVIGVLGFVGYSVHNRQNTAKPAITSANANQPASSGSAKATNVASSPRVSSTSDLDTASATLDQTDPSSSNNADTSQLDSQTANF